MDLFEHHFRTFQRIKYNGFSISFIIYVNDNKKEKKNRQKEEKIKIRKLIRSRL